MELNIWIEIAGIILFFLMVDILGHSLMKLKRGLGEWLLITALSLSFVGSGFLGVRQWIGRSDSDNSYVYMAYRYLEEGDADRAAALLSEISGTHDEEKNILSVACDLMNEDYIAGHFKLQQLLEQSSMDKHTKKCVDALESYCSEKLGISENTSDITDYDSYLASLESEWSQEDTDSDEPDADDAAVIDALSEYIEDLDFSDKEDDYEDQYELDCQINGMDVSELDEYDMEELEEAYGETEEVLRREVSYYVYNGDFEEAEEKAKLLNDKYESAENIVIYTDVIAEKVYQSERSYYDSIDDRYDMDDEEVSSLVDEAESALEKAEDLIDRYGYDGDRADEIDELLEEADECYEAADNVALKRAVNYVTANEPASGDDTGYYELQLSKLYLAMDDRDSANEHLHNVIDNSAAISEDSSLKEAVDKVVAEYNKISDDSYNAELNAAVNEMVEEQSNNVVPANDGSINGSFSSYVSTTLKYDRINIHISRIDTSDYPRIKAYINVNGTKNSEEELANEFTKEDFSVIDTQYEITDYTLKSGAESGGVNIAIVMDKSGSMDGDPIENAKQAAEEAVNHMGDNEESMMVISYDDSAYVEQSLTSKTGILKQSISGITSGGGTNISAGLQLALDNLDSADGSRAVILMSDGQDGGSEEDMNSATLRASSMGISVYTVGFGDCDDAYMQSIADATGGKYMKASDSTELSDIYLNLQRYIVNNYTIEYEVTKNTETDPRYLMVDISEYNATETKEYYVNEANRPEGDEEGSFMQKVDENTLAIASVTPGNVSLKDVQNGVSITVSGGGFADIESVKVGKTVLTNVNVVDKTTITGDLQGDISEGVYDVEVKTTDGRLTIGKSKFKVFRAGTSTSVRLGVMTITADSIGQVSDNKFVASGNVMINKFLHSDGDMEITVTDIGNIEESSDSEKAGSSGVNVDLVQGKTVKIGEGGTVSGQSRLYVSYAEISGDSGFGYSELVLGGKDYVLAKDSYYATVDTEKTSFDEELSSLDITIPMIMDVKESDVHLYSNCIKIDIKTFNIDKLADDITKGLTGEAEKEITNAQRVKNRTNGKQSVDGRLSIVLTGEGLRFGGEVTIKNNLINLKVFKLKEVSLKLDSYDKDHEYWKIGGALDLSDVTSSVAGFLFPGESDEMDKKLSISLGSYYWLPDSLEVSLEADPGRMMCKVLEMKKIGAKIQGMSTICLKLYEAVVSDKTFEILGTDMNNKNYNYQDIKLEGNIEGDINVLASLGNSGLAKRLTAMGRIGTLKGTVSVKFPLSEFEFEAKGELASADGSAAKANAKLSFGVSPSPKLTADLGLSVDISGLGCSIQGGGATSLSIDKTSVKYSQSVNGSVDIPYVGLHAKGDIGVAFEVKWDLSLIKLTVTLNGNNEHHETAVWYEDDGSPKLWNRVHSSSY